MDATPDLQLPLSSLRLLVPPVRLMSACMWQVAQQRNVEQYGKLSEFITLVTEMVPELMSPKQKTQLILGLRARFILELLQRVGPFDCEAIQDHLNSFQLWTTNHMHEEVQDGEVAVSKSKFVELVRKLMNDQTEKETFFKEVFPVQYGACFDTMLQILLWEFFFRLEEFLPVPSFSQVAASFDLAHLDPQFEQFVCDPEDLRMLLQHRKWRQKFTKSEFSFMSDTILSTLASKQTSVTCEDQTDHQSLGRNEEDATDDSSIETVPSDSQLQEDRPLPLTSSACGEEAGMAGDSAQLSHNSDAILRILASKRTSEVCEDREQHIEEHIMSRRRDGKSWRKAKVPVKREKETTGEKTLLEQRMCKINRTHL
ncbi:uncharacterized protein [Centroberyx affinis]|uniref:uncharacterized protein n=1 Tax=Centroberyx affinis TaxID=166261 RepID=UPI003A5B97D3